jgi:hypothetical protein
MIAITLKSAQTGHFIDDLTIGLLRDRESNSTTSLAISRQRALRYLETELGIDPLDMQKVSCTFDMASAAHIVTVLLRQRHKQRAGVMRDA